MLNLQKFKELYENFNASGLTIREYCSNIGIHETTFYYWKKKLKDKFPEGNGFIPVYVKQKTSNGSTGSPVLPERSIINEIRQKSIPPSFEIAYPNGVTVKLNGNHSIETLQGLILLGQPDYV